MQARGRAKNIPATANRGDFVVRPEQGRRVILLNSKGCAYSVGDKMNFSISKMGKKVRYSREFWWDPSNTEGWNEGVDLAFCDISAREILVVGRWAGGSYDLSDITGDLEGKEGTFMYPGGVVGGNYFHCLSGDSTKLNLLPERVISGDMGAKTDCDGGVGQSVLTYVSAPPGNLYRRQLEALIARALADIPDPCFRVPTSR